MTGARPAARRRARGRWQPVLLVVALALNVAGCVTSGTTAPVAPAADWTAERSRLQSLDRFSLHGRVAVSTGAEGFNGSLAWDQNRGLSSLEIDGPLGAGGLRLETDGKSLSLATSRGDRLDGEAARAELERRLGFALPLASLRYWIVGAPDPGLPATETVGADQRLASLGQAGWRVDYPQYVAVAADSRPKRVTLQRDAARVRLIVDRWDR